MEIKVQSIKFDADQKLLEFIDKKVSKFPRFFDNIVSTDITLSLLQDHAKCVKMNVGVPSGPIVVERTGNSFETAVNECCDIIKEQLTKKKEILQG